MKRELLVGRKIVPRVPSTAVEKRAQRATLVCALDALIVQLAQIDERGLASDALDLKLRLIGRKAKVDKRRRLKGLYDALVSLNDGRDNDTLGRITKRAYEAVGEYRELLELRAGALAARANTQ